METGSRGRDGVAAILAGEDGLITGRILFVVITLHVVWQGQMAECPLVNRTVPCNQPCPVSHDFPDGSRGLTDLHGVAGPQPLPRANHALPVLWRHCLQSQQFKAPVI